MDEQSKNPFLKPYIPTLDGLRGIAIILVMLAHSTSYGVLEGTTAFDTAYLMFAGIGRYGVDLFFVLSGFLITRILYATKESNHYFRNFYLRRFLRIFPLYYAFLTIVLVILPYFYPAVQAISQSATPSLAYWLYLQNFAIAIKGEWAHVVLNVTWSLAIEEQFYLIFPWLVWFYNRSQLILMVGIAIIGVLVLRVTLISLGVQPIPIFVLTLTRMDALLLGALIALFSVQGKKILSLVPTLSKLVIPLGALLVLLIGWIDQFKWSGKFTQTFGFTGLAFFFGSLLILSIGLPSDHPLIQVLNHPVIKRFGKYSYALYLFHMPVLLLIKPFFINNNRSLSIYSSQLPSQALFYTAIFSITMGVAALSWNFYEKLFLDFKKHFL